VMLASQPAVERNFLPYVSTNVPQSLIDSWFAPQAAGDDLVAAATSSIEYRVEPGFQTFAGSVQRDPSVASGGTVVVRVLVDDQVQWEETLQGRSAKGFRVDIADARRVRLEVAPGDDGDVGDQIRFLKARFLK